MVKKYICDACQNELNEMEVKLTDMDPLFDTFRMLGREEHKFDLFINGQLQENKENLATITKKNKMIKGIYIKDIMRPQLCQSCLKGYNELIFETNKKIINYLKEKRKVE